MSKINILTDETINKIAAGEVIERPASVIKELLENSLDAKASNITVKIKNSIFDHLEISDNGEGMSPEDAQKCFLRHATSKINKSSDLFSLTSLGFRGEALPSICAISNTTIITKQKQNLSGIKLIIENEKLKKITSIATSTGTKIIVEKLFANVPARKKFLKSEGYEKSKITELIHNYALGWGNINFKFHTDQKEIFFIPSHLNLLERTVKIMGLKKTACFYEKSPLIYGTHAGFCELVITSPEVNFPSRKKQIIFVNKRLVKYFPLNKTLEDVLFLPKNRYPAFVCILDLPPHIIDANCHPQKTEIKISQGKEILTQIKNYLENKLKHYLVQIFKSNTEFESHTTYTNFKFNLQKNVLKETPVSFETSFKSPLFIKDFIPSFNYLGQAFLTYLIVEKNNNLILADQHALHERILYEKIKKEDVKINKQFLLLGNVLKLNPTEIQFAFENIDLLKEFGFEIELFGNNEIVLKTLPNILGKNLPESCFLECLNLILENKNNLEVKKKILQMFACRRAVKSGDKLSVPEAENLLVYFNDLENLGCEILFCAHNRPTVFVLGKSEIEKKFLRK